MAQNTGTFSPGGGGSAVPSSPGRGGSAAPSSTTGIARDEAANVAETARQAGTNVAGTATDQAKQVMAETRAQARDLLGEVRGQARQQASAQQRKASQSLHMLAGQLDDMATKSGEQGMGTQLVQEASHRVRKIAWWLERREPGDVVGEVRDFARRRPGAFLLGAAVAGVVAGRMTRGAAATAGPGQPESPPQGEAMTVPAPVTPSIAEPGNAWSAAEDSPAAGYGPASGPAAGPGARPASGPLAQGVNEGTRSSDDLPYGPGQP